MKLELHLSWIRKRIALGRGNLIGDYKKISLEYKQTMI
jgi:hypothetical protein